MSFFVSPTWKSFLRIKCDCWSNLRGNCFARMLKKVAKVVKIILKQLFQVFWGKIVKFPKFACLLFSSTSAIKVSNFFFSADKIKLHKQIHKIYIKVSLKKGEEIFFQPTFIQPSACIIYEKPKVSAFPRNFISLLRNVCTTCLRQQHELFLFIHLSPPPRAQEKKIKDTSCSLQIWDLHDDDDLNFCVVWVAMILEWNVYLTWLEVIHGDNLRKIDTVPGIIMVSS